VPGSRCAAASAAMVWVAAAACVCACICACSAGAVAAETAARRAEHTMRAWAASRASKIESTVNACIAERVRSLHGGLRESDTVDVVVLMVPGESQRGAPFESLVRTLLSREEDLVDLIILGMPPSAKASELGNPRLCFVDAGGYSIEQLRTVVKLDELASLYADDEAQQYIELSVSTELNKREASTLLAAARNVHSRAALSAIVVDSQDFGAVLALRDDMDASKSKTRYVINHSALLAGFSVPMNRLLPLRLPIYGGLRGSSWSTRVTQPLFHILAFLARRKRLKFVNDGAAAAARSDVPMNSDAQPMPQKLRTFDSLYDNSILAVNTVFGIEYWRSSHELAFTDAVQVEMIGPVGAVRAVPGSSVDKASEMVVVSIASVLRISSQLQSAVLQAVCALKCEVVWFAHSESEASFVEDLNRQNAFCSMDRGSLLSVRRSSARIETKTIELSQAKVLVTECDLAFAQSAIMAGARALLCMPIESSHADVAHRLDDAGLAAFVSASTVATSENAAAALSAALRVAQSDDSRATLEQMRRVLLATNSDDLLAALVLGERAPSGDDCIEDPALREWLREHRKRQSRGALYASRREAVEWFAPFAIGVIGPLFAVFTALRVYARMILRLAAGTRRALARASAKKQH